MRPPHLLSSAGFHRRTGYGDVHVHVHGDGDGSVYGYGYSYGYGANR